MRKQFFILGSMVCLSQMAFSIEKVSHSHTIESIQDIADSLNTKIINTAESILSIPIGHQTFENTLRAWNQLMEELSSKFDALTVIEETDPLYKASAIQAKESLRNCLLATLRNSQIYQALIDCSERIMN